jgi:predicted nucleic acid-binding protein
MDAAIARGDELVMSSLVLHDVAFAAMASDQAAAKLAQLDAFIAQVDVVPWTSEDALTAARLRADHERTALSAFRLDPSQILCAAQALNNDWTMIAERLPLPGGMRAFAPAFEPFPGLRTIDWSAPNDD